MIENKRKFVMLLVFTLIIAAIVFYVVWGIVLHKGTIQFNENPPFTVVLNGESYKCLESSCEISMAPGDYSYILSKENFYDKSGFVNVERGRTMVIEINLEFIAQTLEGNLYHVFKLPVGYSKHVSRLFDITLFHSFSGDHELKKLPKKITDISFSSSGKQAIVFEGSKVSLYNTHEYIFNEIDQLNGAYDVDWSQDEQFVYTILFDEDINKNTLRKVRLSDGTAKNLIFFIRDIEEYQISVSPNEKFVAVVDETFSPQILYMIDLENATRTNIFEGFLLDLGKWAKDDSLIVFKGKDLDGDKEELMYLNPATPNVEVLSFDANIEHIDFSKNGSAYLVSTQPYSVSGASQPYRVQFQEREEQNYADLLSGEIEEQPIILHKWIPQDGFYFVNDISETVTVPPDKLEVSADGNLVRIISEDNFYDVRIGE